MRIVNASIDVTKIDKTKIVSTNKDGKPFKNGGKFLDISIFINDEANSFGQDCSIAIGQTKEEREAGETKVYIGNGKTSFYKPAEAGEYVQAPKAATPNTTLADVDEDDLPF
jgi:hypothetical protein